MACQRARLAWTGCCSSTQDSAALCWQSAKYCVCHARQVGDVSPWCTVDAELLGIVRQTIHQVSRTAIVWLNYLKMAKP
jgi:hypothetical protein